MKNGDIARNVSHNIAEGVSHMVDAGRKVVIETAGDAKDVVVENTGKAATAFAKVVRKRPILSVGIAFAVGYLVMRFVRR
ncbi:MAG TPA: hypothetical protein VGL61_04060 [Kofleriaceae bacterium]|jgi:ElaB/YqjD/DUF883 family membrane-anchored ribosome-binding protein